MTPGDDLVMEMSLVSFDDRLGFATMTGKAYVGGKVCVILLLFMCACIMIVCIIAEFICMICVYVYIFPR